MAEKNFPNTGKRSDNWITNAGSIPVSMRGDCQQLPSINFENFSTNKNLKDGIERFGDQWKSRKTFEEMRLAYVAITRAKQGLICTTSHFRTGENVVAPSRLFQLFATAAINIPGASVVADSQIPDGINPMKENPLNATWPRSNPAILKLQQVAKLVDSAQPFTNQEVEHLIATLADEEKISLLRDLQMIINEIKLKSNQQDIVLPTRLSVSTLLTIFISPFSSKISAGLTV